jgi:hypothetical protein
VRGDPDERKVSNPLSDKDLNVKAVGRGYCGKLIMEGVLYVVVDSAVLVALRANWSSSSPPPPPAWGADCGARLS